MRQQVLQLAWWQTFALAGGLMVWYAKELALPRNAFWSFFSRYLLFALLGTAVALRFVPRSLQSELPDVLFRVGFMRRT